MLRFVMQVLRPTQDLTWNNDIQPVVSHIISFSPNIGQIKICCSFLLLSFGTGYKNRVSVFLLQHLLFSCLKVLNKTVGLHTRRRENLKYHLK
jgi:hypothetical protein